MNGENAGSAVTYTYDANDNRLTKVAGSTTTTTVPSTSNKISAVGAAGYIYDNAGNITADGVNTYVWNAAGQLKEVKVSGSTVGTYTYDSQNRRTKKVAGGVTTYYVYGAGGLLYGEYNGSGALRQEYVYLNGSPLAQIKAGSPEVLTYIHTDHLGTPRFGTSTGGSTAWTWASDAFGVGTPSGSRTINLRMAGQYFDSESGLFYNRNRYYNPAIGRYVSSDPIGLGGGLNTFSYVEASPVMYSDPEGLAPMSCSPYDLECQAENDHDQATHGGRKPCPDYKHQIDGQEGWKDANGTFHCGWPTYKEDHDASPTDPTNECVYDDDGCLVDENDPQYPDCWGTVDSYPDDDIRHSIPTPWDPAYDPGGIYGSGGPAATDSAKKATRRIIESIPTPYDPWMPEGAKICGCKRIQDAQ